MVEFAVYSYYITCGCVFIFFEKHGTLASFNGTIPAASSCQAVLGLNTRICGDACVRTSKKHKQVKTCNLAPAGQDGCQT